MRQLFPLLALLALTGCGSPSGSQQTSLDERIARIENGIQNRVQIQGLDNPRFNIEDRMRELGIPGVSIAVINNGVIEWAKGYGMADSSENREVTTETLFLAGSISKPVATFRTHQLVEQGIIHLDSNVNNYLSSWKLPDNEFTVNEKVTARRIMNHSAGLTTWGFPGYKRGDTIPTIPEVLDGKGNTGPVRVYKEPGGNWQYSGGGYTIMQLMITDIDQQSFPETMKTHVLDPLGMVSSTYENPLPQQYHARAATGYRSNGNEVTGKWHVYPEMAAAGLWTTPSELILWAKEIQQVLQSGSDGLLKTETVKEMLIPTEDDQGLGPYVVNDFFGHGGADEGFRAELYAWKDKANAVVIMTNSDLGSSFMQEIMLSLAAEYDLPGIEPINRVYNEKPQSELERYAGTYRFPNRGDATMIVKDKGLQFSGGPFSGIINLLPENDSTFFNRQTGLYYRFAIEGEQVKGVTYARNTSEKID